MPQLYRSSSSNSVVRKPSRQAASIGTALSRGLGQLGQVAGTIAKDNAATDRIVERAQDDIAVREKRRERARRTVEFSGQVGQARRVYQEWQVEARTETEAGAPGWSVRAAEKQEELFGPLLDNFADDEELALRLAPVLQSLTSQLHSREVAWEEEQSLKWQGESFKALLDTERDGLQGTPAEEMADALTASLARVDIVLGEMDIPGTQREIIRRAAQTTLLTNGAMDGLLEQGQYSSVRELIESGEFDGMLGGTRDNYISAVAAGERQQAIAAEKAESEARDEWRVQRNVIESKLERGETISPAEMSTFLRQGKQLGVPDDELQEAGFLTQDSIYRDGARGMDDGKLGRSISALSDKRAAGELSNEEIRYMDALEKEQGQRDSAKGGSIRELSRAGPAGQVEAVHQLQGMDLERRWAAANEAGDTRLAIYAGLSRNGVTAAVQGRAVRSARKEDYLPPSKVNRSSIRIVKDGTKAVLGPALVRQLGGNFSDVVDTALDIMAGTNDKWSEDEFKASLQVIYGRTRRPDRSFQGGFGKVFGRIVELPPTLNAGELEGTFSRFEFANAYYAGGIKANRQDVLKNFTPVVVGDAVKRGRVQYKFVDAQGHPLLRADKTILILNAGNSR